MMTVRCDEDVKPFAVGRAGVTVDELYDSGPEPIAADDDAAGGGEGKRRAEEHRWNVCSYYVAPYSA